MPQLQQSRARFRVDHEHQVVRLAFSPPPPGAELAPVRPRGPREVVSAALLALKATRVDDGVRAVVALAHAVGIHLAPATEAGWSDLRAWALEPVAAPEHTDEAAKLLLDATYVAHLQGRPLPPASPLDVASAGAGGGVLELAPRLTVEPLITHFERRADSYRFLRAELAATFGEEALGEMHGLRDGVAVAQPLGMELAAMIHLYDGAAAAAMRELGIASTWSAAAFEHWRAERDPDVDADLREMVRLEERDERGRTKVRMMLGWERASLLASFAAPPSIEMPYLLAMPLTIDAYVSHVLGRDAFRALCDRHRTKEAITRALA